MHGCLSVTSNRTPYKQWQGDYGVGLELLVYGFIRSNTEDITNLIVPSDIKYICMRYTNHMIISALKTVKKSHLDKTVCHNNLGHIISII